MTTRAPRGSEHPLPRISALVMRGFATYSRYYIGRHFHAVRLLASARPKTDGARPVVIYLNHAAWWDPLVCLVLSRLFFADRSSFAPIDGAMFRRYGIFRHVGFFGVEQNSPRGGRAFLRTARAILATSAHALWLTPQGRFTDVRERPPRLQAGLGVLALHAPEAMYLPLAIEYSFWTEPRPEILLSFGTPIVPCDHPERSSAEWTEAFSAGLAAAQDELATRSAARVPEDWVTLGRGKSGVNLVYDLWQRFSARLRGESFHPDHLPEAPR